MRKLLPLLLLSALSAAPGPRANEMLPGGIRTVSPLPEGPVAFALTAIPPRPAGALSGTEFAGRTGGMKGIDRQRAAVAAILGGNVPDFMRQLKPVHLARELTSGTTVEAIVWVTPDYLAIGSGKDFLRMPLNLPSATTVANAFGCVLPTTRIVDAVYRQSKVHLVPDPLPPGPQMRSIAYFLRHRRLIARQLTGIPLGELLAGHKKDVVLTERLATRPDRIAIYGWQRPSGDPIQPLSTIHGARYADYSHGVRLVWATVLVGGEPRSIYDVLEDPELAPVLSDEGVMRDAWKIMHPNVKSPPAKTPKRLERG